MELVNCNGNLVVIEIMEYSICLQQLIKIEFVNCSVNLVAGNIPEWLFFWIWECWSINNFPEDEREIWMRMWKFYAMEEGAIEWLTGHTKLNSDLTSRFGSHFLRIYRPVLGLLNNHVRNHGNWGKSGVPHTLFQCEQHYDRSGHS